MPVIDPDSIFRKLASDRARMETLPCTVPLQAWLRALRSRVAVCRYEIEWAMNEICLKFIHFGERVAV
jgi:hypothetical protein